MSQDATTKARVGDHDTAIGDAAAVLASAVRGRGAITGPTGLVLTHEAHHALIGFWCLWQISDDGIDGVIRRGIARSTAYKIKARFKAFYGVEIDQGAPFRPSELQRLYEVLASAEAAVPERVRRVSR